MTKKTEAKHIPGSWQTPEGDRIRKMEKLKAINKELLEAAKTMLNVVQGLKMQSPETGPYTRLQFRIIEAHEKMLKAAIAKAEGR